MSSINKQIDAAVDVMKARAAEFDDTREVGADDTPLALLRRIDTNLTRAAIAVKWSKDAADAVTHLADVMNLSALAIDAVKRGEL